MRNPSIFIAATGQNVGKTTLCLGIQSALRSHVSSVGFIKPVGQQYLNVEGGIRVDKDAYLFKKLFSLPQDYSTLSPVLFPAGLTRDYIDGHVDTNRLRKAILSSFDEVNAAHPFTIVEGTGHVGVGSLLGLNNADVAHLLDVAIIIIASGGLGSAFDELALNIEMCKAKGVEVRGVILNRVHNDKREMIVDYFGRALRTLNIPLLGCIPFSERLCHPTMENYSQLFRTELLAGTARKHDQFSRSRLVAGSLESFLSDMTDSELIIMPACRMDIIEAVYAPDFDASPFSRGHYGVILSGRTPPCDGALKLIRASQIPTLYAPCCSFDVMKSITSFTAKIGPEDTEKAERIIELVRENVDVERLLEIGCASVL
ncbi:MAG: AAA family ATPase [Chlamydiia bacterium]|nr:AAA family ATPase [Chlamydiia bacterium]